MDAEHSPDYLCFAREAMTVGRYSIAAKHAIALPLRNRTDGPGCREGEHLLATVRVMEQAHE